MPHEVILDIDKLIAICGVIVAVGGAAAVLYKLIKPLLKPLEKLDERIDALEKRNSECTEYFTHDKERLDEHDELLKAQAEDTKIIMKSIALLMVHAETGNHTGEVRAGRMELEEYLIDR